MCGCANAENRLQSPFTRLFYRVGGSNGIAACVPRIIYHHQQQHTTVSVLVVGAYCLFPHLLVVVVSVLIGREKSNTR